MMSPAYSSCSARSAVTRVIRRFAPSLLSMLCFACTDGAPTRPTPATPDPVSISEELILTRVMNQPLEGTLTFFALDGSVTQITWTLVNVVKGPA